MGNFTRSCGKEQCVDVISIICNYLGRVWRHVWPEIGSAADSDESCISAYINGGQTNSNIFLLLICFTA